MDAEKLREMGLEKTAKYREWQSMDSCQGQACDDCQYLDDLCAEDPDCRSDNAIDELLTHLEAVERERDRWEWVARDLLWCWSPVGHGEEVVNPCPACQMPFDERVSDDVWRETRIHQSLARYDAANPAPEKEADRG